MVENSATVAHVRGNGHSHNNNSQAYPCTTPEKPRESPAFMIKNRMPTISIKCRNDIVNDLFRYSIAKHTGLPGSESARVSDRRKTVFWSTIARRG